MTSSGNKLTKMFSSLELLRLYEYGQLNKMLEQLGSLINPKTFETSGGDVSVFNYNKDGQKYVIKIAPKNIRFFRHFGRGDHSAIDFQKYINRLEPFFVPVEEIMYEDENIFVYTQKKCKVVESSRINKKTVIDVFRLVQFMLINDIILTDLAPHNLGLYQGHVVVFDYHGLHRLTENGAIKEIDWWKRLVRNLTRFICGLYNQRKRPLYSDLMQNCDARVIKKMEDDAFFPSEFINFIKFVMIEGRNAKIETMCEYLQGCIDYITKH
jgi:hypothetical protein